ncbi:MAG: aspartate aminotransferase family protein [Phycisphaerales bacterium]|nr:aspartate aminotransferase family protein [Phycisphaerales bacterium]
MNQEEFRQLGHRFIDWIADYWSRLDEFPVLSQVKPGDILAQLPMSPPATGFSSSSAQSPVPSASSWDPVFRDLESIILPGITHWQAPRFYAYFPCNASPPAVLGELLSAGLNVQGMLWATSPACTELEIRVMDWLAEMVGLPEQFRSTSPNGGGVIQGTASEATLVAMVAARDRARRALATDPNAECRIPNAGPFTIYASTQAHSSVIKAAMIAGIATSPDDREHIRLVETDANLAMRPEALEAAIRADLAAGKVPCFIAATVGTTSTTAVDPVDRIAEAIATSTSCLRASVPSCPPPWLHVDAAHSGAACICPEHRWMLRGIERADSFCFNPHKWLLTNFDCDAFWTSDRAALTRALSITPEYLRNQASDAGAVTDYRDWQIPLGRRFRALKLWFVIRHYGVAGLQAHIRGHIDMARRFEELVAADDRFELAAPRTVNLVCFRAKDPSGNPDRADRLNRDLLAAVNTSGRAYLSHTVIPGPAGRPAHTLRMAIGAPATQPGHIEEAWDLIRLHAARLLGSGS